MKKFVTIVSLLVICLCFVSLAACEKPCSHTNTKWVVDSQPSCTEAGTRHQVCLDCGETVVESQTITALGHALEKGVCTRCGYKHQTSGLAYSEIFDDEGKNVVAYAVTGMGEATDTYVVVPKEYNNLPVTAISASAFAQCGALTNVVLSENILRVETYAFKDCTSLTSINMPDGLRYIGWYAFSGCSSLAKIEIPQSVLSVGKYAFDRCENLEEISVADGNVNYKSVDGNLYNKNCTSLLRYAIGKEAEAFEVPASVKTLEEGCFADSSLKTVTFAQDGKLGVIGNNAFSNSKKLSAIDIPNTVTVLGEFVFGSCHALTNVKLSESVVTLNSGLFSDCSSLTSIVIPRRVRLISSFAFSFCSALQSITVDENNTAFKSIDGNLYNFDGTRLIKYASAKREKEFVLPNAVTSVGEYAFERCNSLEKVVVSAQVTVMEKNAFYNCDLLTVFCQAEFQPDSWSEFWLYHSSKEVNVQWGYAN